MEIGGPKTKTEGPKTEIGDAKTEIGWANGQIGVAPENREISIETTPYIQVAFSGGIIMGDKPAEL